MCVCVGARACTYEYISYFLREGDPANFNGLFLSQPVDCQREKIGLKCINEYEIKLLDFLQVKWKSILR